MKTGEIWKYKNWVCNLVDKTTNEYNESAGGISLDAVRVEIIALREEIVWFKEIRLEDSEFMVNRETFVQIFEKIY